MDVGAAVSPIVDGLYLSGVQGASEHAFVLSKNIRVILTFWDRQPKGEGHTLPFYHDIDVFHFCPKITSTPGMKRGTVPKYADIVFDKVNDVISRHPRDAARGSVLMCCENGINHSAAFAVAFIMRWKKCDLQQAMHFVKARRTVVRLSDTMKQSLIQYQQMLYPPPPLSSPTNPQETTATSKNDE